MPRCTPRSASSSRWPAAKASAWFGLVLLGATALSSASAQEASWRRDVAALLQTRARAVLESDRDVFDSTMAAAPRSFRASELRWFDRVRALPLTVYEIELDPDAPEDLSPALGRESAGADEVRVVVATERLGLGAYDPEPTAGALILTVARHGRDWSIVADDDLEDLGMFTDREVWDLAPVDALERGDVLALHHDEPAVGSDLASRLGDAIAYVQDAWPLAWPARTVLSIPRSASDLATIFHTTVDLSPFVAFAASSAERAGDGIRVGGIRVYIQPETYFDQPASYREDVLSHEMVHVAAAAVRGAFTSAWLEEGVAQFYGERTFDGTPRLDARVSSGTFVGRLPEDHEFFLGDEVDIGTSYDAALSFARFVAAEHGRDAPARLYEAIGAESPVSFGTARYHLDRAARRALGVGFAALEGAWLRSIGAAG